MFTKACFVKPNLSSSSPKYFSVLPLRQPAPHLLASGSWGPCLSVPPLFLSHQPPPQPHCLTVSHWPPPDFLHPHLPASGSWGPCLSAPPLSCSFHTSLHLSLTVSHWPPPDFLHQKSSLPWGHCSMHPAPDHQPPSIMRQEQTPAMVPQLSGPHQLFLSSAPLQALHPLTAGLLLSASAFSPLSSLHPTPTLKTIPLFPGCLSVTCAYGKKPGFPLCSMAPANLVMKRAHTHAKLFFASTSVTEVSFPTSEESNRWRVRKLLARN